jgi:phosphoserine phosphatase
MPIYIIHTDVLSAEAAARLGRDCDGQITAGDGYHVLQSESALSAEQLQKLSDQWQVDINPVPEQFDAARTRLLITDMDSTLINIECVDEIADFAGKKAEVAAITEAAMRGELDFNASLTRRVAVLAGLNTSVLEEVYEHRLRLNPGAEALISGLRPQDIKTALVSGGFTFFTERLKKRLGFDYVLSNVLDVNDGKLTGKVIGDIVNADGKAAFLQRLCEDNGISTRQAIAVGDGANDLKMMNLAGLSVAYRAKPKVQQQAHIKINYSGLDSILHLLHFAKNPKGAGA